MDRADLYLFDDLGAERWAPFRLTRPVGELLYGCLLLRERQERFWGEACRGHLAGEHLFGFREPGSPPAIRPAQVEEDRPRILVSSRFVPDFGPAPDVDGPATLVADGGTVGWILPPGTPTPGPEALARPDGAPAAGERISLDGEVLAHPWTLVAGNAERITRDVPELFPHSHAFLPAEVESLGTGSISTGENVELEPGVLLDAREGPIRLEDDVRVQAPTRLAGPAWVGSGCRVLGGNVGRVSIGPVCKVRGEVEDTVITGFCNKAHDGYLGHALLGRWVNLGAGTTNSDLKNNYGTVRVRTGETEADTGLMKVGCFLGDHVKTGIGTLLNTGTVVGAGSNVYGGRMPPKYVPPFSWGAGSELGVHRLDAFLETAARVLARRDHELTEELRSVLRRAWERTAGRRDA